MADGPREQEHRAGRARRKAVARSSHGVWEPAPDRADPISLLAAQNRDRIADLVPVRWGRMLESPFAFLRGAAAVMAADLATTPRSGITVQACGDAHVANFGMSASPERILLFDVNDFDETWPGPFEWDLKRLATSAVVVARGERLGDQQGVAAARAAVRSYRHHMRRYAASGVVEVWYSRVDAAAARMLGADPAAPVKTALDRARRHTSRSALPRLTELAADGARRIVDHPPLVTHDIGSHESEAFEPLFASYRQSLDDARRVLIDRFTLVDVARKVVGVGSVGTRCFIALLTSDVGEPLFLQMKEAGVSVLAGYGRLPGPATPQPGPRPATGGQGRRVVDGQRLMQAASDIFLGAASWRGRDYYVRQLRDMKEAINAATLDAAGLVGYLELCGWTLARAHARSGPAATIAGYMGGGDHLEEAVARFAVAYADQTERDHALLVEAVRSGRVGGGSRPLRAGGWRRLGGRRRCQLVDLTHLGVVEVPVPGGGVGLHLGAGGGAGDDRGHLLVAEEPGHGQLQQAVPLRFGEGAQPLDGGQLRVEGGVMVGLHARQAATGGRRLAQLVLPGQEPGGQREVRHEGDARPAALGEDLALGGALQEAVFVLDGDEPRRVAADRRPRLTQLLGREVRASDLAHFPAFTHASNAPKVSAMGVVASGAWRM